ncbi:MAG: selenium metabolism-associated LysR family transcriptional regulator [Coriobacteriia bacterium]|nr:selenium metabolism-associated LysR family transcriptional regulator [Coriobacteriia bacterium]
MEFRQLEAYLKVVQLGSFSKAAKELHVSQPSVSTYISQLERELGVTLLNRSTKVVSPTLAGERFLERAREMIEQRDRSIDAMFELTHDHAGVIRIAASSVPATSLLPRALASFHKLYPKVSFVVEHADTAATVQAVAENRADLGFAGSIIEGSNCHFEEFADEELIFIGPAGTGGARSASKVYSLAELLHEGCFIARELGSGTRLAYEKFFVEAGIDLAGINTCATMGDTQSTINCVAAGLGVSIVSEIAARDAIEHGQVVALRCADQLPQRKIYSVLNRRVKQSHLVELFLKQLS